MNKMEVLGLQGLDEYVDILLSDEHLGMMCANEEDAVKALTPQNKGHSLEEIYIHFEQYITNEV
jgi:hypothetical protein